MTMHARIAAILDALQDIAGGDLDRRLTISDAHDELDAIAHAINVVAGELHYTTGSLSRARDLAEQASAAKTTILRNVSHELRTPVSAILGITQLLQMPDLAPAQREDLYARITANVRAQIGLLDDLLDLSQVESGKLAIAMRPIPVSSVLREAVTLLEPSAVRKGLALILEQAGDPRADPHVLGDRRRLHQILANVIGNAIKFTTSGRIVVRVEREGHDIAINIADTGIGIDPAHVAHLFEPFAQAEPGIGARFGGSGLGLALARGLAREMAGDLAIVATAPGSGTTFQLRLPEWQIVHESDDVRPAGAPLTPEPLLDSVCVLLVDDHEDIRTSLTRLLELFGATVHQASSGGEAIEVGARSGIDVILMDLRMPDIDGLEATRRLRALGVGTPIVALTADIVADHRGDFANAGCTTKLAKPVDADRLIAMIRSLVDRI